MVTTWKFDFGPDGDEAGCPREGFVRIGERSVYETGVGYGFTEGGAVTAKDRGEGEWPLREFCIPYGATFRVDVPNGNYVVTLTMGDAIAPVACSVRANHKPMLSGVAVPAGLAKTERFAVHVSDGSLRLTFGGAAPRVNALEIAAVPQALTLFLAGDSTVTDEGEANFPYAGWGMLLPCLLKHDVAVGNYASSGRSSKSFIDEGRLDRIVEQLKANDFLFIQFGHNDQKADVERHTEPEDSYKAYLLRYVDAARAKGAYPVLVTSVHRRYFEPGGTLRDTHGAYLTAMRELADAEGVPLIDLAARSQELFERLGPEATKDVFMWSAPGEYAGFPDGAQDNTHFQERGAARIAALVAEEIRRLNLWPLTMYLR
ncbi:rhamnogalacturonan acetylesterase [Paenibacillus sp. TRM 82003]|nr:rhamnogalacturonan acetylesterase [Paenibacillus sp. TRM 82003]